MTGRYCFDKHSRPLWFTSYVNAKEKNKKCPQCNEHLIFECQINSNVLKFHASIVDLDLGVAAIYSCPKSCNMSESEG